MTKSLDPGQSFDEGADSACWLAALEYRRTFGWCTVGVCDPQHAGEPSWHTQGMSACRSPGKSPMGRWKHLQERLVTEDELRRYWEEHPGRNVGMICGSVSGVLWLDVDGAAGLDRFYRDSGLTALPPTATSENSAHRESRHYCFKLPSGRRMRSTAKNEPAAKHNGYSILAEGGHCVLPPSRHSNGGRYQWLPGLSPFQIAIAPAPAALLDLCLYDQFGDDRQVRPPVEFRIASVEPILNGCAFLRHFRDDAAVLGYDEWFAGLQIVAHCADGDRLAHQFSAPYSGYFFEETQAKVDEIRQKCSPRTCESLSRLGNYCQGCVARINGCHSPISLGMSARQTPSSPSADGLAVRTVGRLSLVPDVVRRTAAKVLVDVSIRQDDNEIDAFKLTDADSSRKRFVNAVGIHLGDDFPALRTTLETAAAQILVSARAHFKKSTSGVENGIDMKTIVGAEVRKRVDLVYVDQGGKVFDRLAGRSISRNGFIERFSNNELVAMTASACDAPRDEEGRLNRGATVVALERELRLLWGDLTRDLAGVEHADLGPASEAAKKFRATIVLAWTKLDAWSVNKRVISDHTGDGESVQLMLRGSLVSVLRGELYAADNVATAMPDAKWRTTKEGREAYFRRIVDDANRPSAILGMRFELLGQLNVPPPEGATDQRSFRQLGLRYGVFTEGLNVPDRMNRGRVRLAILSPELVDELLGEPASGDDVAGAGDDLGAAGDGESAPASPVSSPEITTSAANG